MFLEEYIENIERIKVSLKEIIKEDDKRSGDYA